MNVMVDTNVILDVILKRKPHFLASYEVLSLAAQNKIQVSLTASCVTDIYYLLRKSNMDDSSSRNALGQLFVIAQLVDVQADDIHHALGSPVADFEDAVIVEVARRQACQFIITRNTQDFKASDIDAVNPTDFIETLKTL